MEIENLTANKDKCWYRGICNRDSCGEKFCMRNYKMQWLAKASLLEGNQMYPIQLRLDADGTDREPYKYLKEIQEDMRCFVENGKNLLIYSNNTGNGKTEWAKKLMLSWLDSIWYSTELTCRGLFISVPTLLRLYVSNINNPSEQFKYIDDNIYNADLIVWDELNSKDYTEYEHNYLLNVINHRISTGKANIFTTNYTLPIINKKLGSRLGSRIVGGSIKVEFKGADKRSWGVN